MARGPVLVVEDNAETREILQRVLAVKGYATIAAEDGVAALRVLRGRRPVSLILLDIHMPRMDGRAFLRELKADPALRDLPVVTFSADASPVPDVVAQIRKGDDPDLLLAAIERTLAKL